jgi:hypothetical protein
MVGDDDRNSKNERRINTTEETSTIETTHVSSIMLRDSRMPDIFKKINYI